jgi:Ser/Thr protein kinase RdoA (MazF antagonist)
MNGSQVGFVARICLLFDLGDPQQAVIGSVPGNANRLWKLETDQGAFVVKEFRYTIEDKRWVTAITRAAEFEFEVWQTKRVPIARPIRSKDGALVHLIMGSRGRPALVRLHRWLDGMPITRPVPLPMAAAAGSLLSDIHSLGSRFANSARGKLRWWRSDPAGTLSRLRRVGLLDAVTAEAGSSALLDAEILITAGEATPGRWIFSHYDYKPENALSIAGALAVLDWDEAALCHPRLATVESAVHWAGTGDGKINPAAFGSFVDNYQRCGGKLGELRPSDFAKCVASTVGWFEYLGRRALREFDDNDAEAAAAAQEAVTTIASLGPTITEVHKWSTLGL